MKIAAISGAVAATLVFLFVFLVIGSTDSNNKICEEFYLKGRFSLGTMPCKAVNDKEYSQVSIIVGNTANNVSPTLSDELKEYIAGSILDRDYPASIQILSATPEKNLIPYNDYKPNKYKNIAELKKEIEEAIGDIETSLHNSPRTDGLDYMKNIEQAASEMSNCSTEKGSKCLIIVLGSGLSDHGKLSFPELDILDGDKNTTSEDVQYIVDGLANAGKVDKVLTNVDVVWQNIGSTVAPQSYLDHANIEKVQTLYEKLLQKEGANNVTFVKTKSKCQKDEDSLPDLQCEERSVDTNGFTVRPTPVRNIEYVYTKVLDSESVEFEANLPVFKESKLSEINSTLDQVASEIKNGINNKAATFTITGYIARISQDDCFLDRPVGTTLDEDRAQAVVNALVARGVDSGHLTAVGGGFGSKAEQCPGGVFDDSDEHKAANRIVIIEG